MTRRTALVTGASMGLGRELVRLFAADGIDVALVARSEDKLRSLAAEVESAHGVRAMVIAADLAEPGAPATITTRLNDEGLVVDYLVNNAGFGTNGSFVELDPERELDMIRVNVLALTNLTRLVAPGMVARGSGRILNIASTAAFQAGPLMAVYYATKAYVLSFSEALAYELRRSGVSVTVHCPGATETEFARTAGNDDSILFKHVGAARAVPVATHAYRAMMSGKVVAVHGLFNKLAAFASRITPRWLLRAMTAIANSPG